MGLRSTTATYNKGQSVTNTSAWSSRWAIPPIILSLDLDLRDFVADVSIIHVHRSQFIYLWDHWLQNALYSTLICFKFLGKCQFPLSFFHKTLEVYFWCSNIILITEDQCFFSGFFYLLCLWIFNHNFKLVFWTRVWACDSHINICCWLIKKEDEF